MHFCVGQRLAHKAFIVHNWIHVQARNVFELPVVLIPALIFTRPSGIFACVHGSTIVLSAAHGSCRPLVGLGLGRVYLAHSACLSFQSFL